MNEHYVVGRSYISICDTDGQNRLKLINIESYKCSNNWSPCGKCPGSLVFEKENKEKLLVTCGFAGDPTFILAPKPRQKEEVFIFKIKL